MKNVLGIFFVMAVLSLGALSPAWAVRVNSVYEADVPVASQSDGDRLQAEPDALAQVLVKISGDSQALNNANLKSALNNADKLVQEFSYAPSPNNKATPFILHIVFDKDGVNRLLRNTSVPTWGQNRPLILAWVEYEVPNQPAVIIDSDSTTSIQPILKKYADQRGLPLLLPMMDMTDMNQVTVNDIVTMTIPTLQTAAKRYASDAMLVARILKNTDGYSVQSKLVIGDKQWTFNANNKTLEPAIKEVMDKVADTMSDKYASVVSEDVQTQITLKVTGVTQQSDLAHVLDYVKHLAPVDDVEPIDVSSSTVLLSVSLRGPKQSFVQAVSGEQKLQPVADPAPNDNTLVYQWNP